MAHLADTLESVTGCGPQAAAELLPRVYDELRHLASARMARWPPGQMLTPTELVHEAYLRVVRRKSAGFEGPRHLFFTVSRAMRDVLVEDARRTACLKRGGHYLRVESEGVEPAPPTPAEDHLDLERALEKLARQSPDGARVVLLSCFMGLTHPEIAETMGLSLATVERKWSRARSWLRRELSRSAPGIDQQVTHLGNPRPGRP